MHIYIYVYIEREINKNTNNNDNNDSNTNMSKSASSSGAPRACQKDAGVYKSKPRAERNARGKVASQCTKNQGARAV